MSVLLVTGTDTGVGKTYVTHALARALVDRGRSVVAVKPVETGCSLHGADHEDGAVLARATGQREPRRALRRFTRPITPALAAEHAGQPVELGPLVSEIEQAAAGADIALVEGAGGLLSPVSWTWTYVDLARALRAQALIVAADRLGCLNHVMLTLRELDRAALDVTGIVLSAPEHPDDSTGTNRSVIERLAAGTPVAAVPRAPDGIAADRIGEIVAWLEP